MKIDEIVETPPSEASLKAKATKNPLRKLYFWTLHWADTPYALPALFIISFAEASFFPVPPDTLLLPLCFARPSKWWIYAFWCTVASVLGAIFGWFIGHFLWAHTSQFFYHYIPGFKPATFDKISHTYQKYGFWVVLVEGLTPIPFKLITISAGVCNVSLQGLIVASIISRGARFFAVAGFIRLFGERVRPFLEKYLDQILIIFFVLLVLGILSIKLLEH